MSYMGVFISTEQGQKGWVLWRVAGLQTEAAFWARFMGFPNNSTGSLVRAQNIRQNMGLEFT